MGFELFKELTAIDGVSGRERDVAAFIREKLEKYADEITTDVNGNVIVFKKGTAENRKKLLFAAHMDEIGLQVIKIEDDGRLMVKEVGSCWIYTTYQSRVRFKNGTVGIVASRVPPEKIDGKHVNLYIDIGVSSKSEAEKYVDIGDLCAYVGEYTDLAGEYYTAKATDDRIGCYLQMEALINNPSPKNDIYMAFTVQEEIGTRGGGVVAYRVKPDAGFAIDVTPAHDRPGDLEGSNTLGGGVAINLSDRYSISDEDLVDMAVNLCKDNNIKYQKSVIYVGGNDAAPINVTREGIKTLPISIVTRYTHGPNAIGHKGDIDEALKLINLIMDANYGC